MDHIGRNTNNTIWLHSLLPIQEYFIAGATKYKHHLFLRMNMMGENRTWLHGNKAELSILTGNKSCVRAISNFCKLYIIQIIYLIGNNIRLLCFWNILQVFWKIFYSCFLKII